MGAFVSRRDPGYIYIIRECYPQNTTRQTGFYKVGKTKNLKSRLSTLQTGNVRKLKYVYDTKVNSMCQAEKRAHNALTQFGANRGGGKEWFYIPDNEIEEVISAAQQWFRES